MNSSINFLFFFFFFWYEWHDLVRKSVIGCNLWEYQGVAPKGLGIYLRIKVEFYLLKYWSIEVFGVLKYWSIWSIEVLKYLEYCSIEVLEYWSIEVLVHWSIEYFVEYFCIFWYLLWYNYFAFVFVIIGSYLWCILCAIGSSVLIFVSRVKDN